MKYILLLLSFVTVELIAQNRFSDDTAVMNIYNHQYNRNAKALLPYLKSPIERHRYHALLAFASIQDKQYAQYLFNALKSDATPVIRKAAAYSLGQLYDTTINAELIGCYKNEKVSEVRNNILEAIGKTADVNTSLFLKDIKPSEVDTAMQIGIARAVYHTARRRRLSPEAKEMTSKLFLITKNSEVRAVCNRVMNPSKPATENAKKTKITLKELDVLFTKKNASAYQQLDILQTKLMAENDWFKLANSSKYVPVQTYCMEQYLAEAKKVHDTTYIKLINSKNVAFVSLACERMRKDSVWSTSVETGVANINEAMQTLIIPRDYEAWLDLYKTKQQLLKEPMNYPNFFESGYQFPIDWEYVKKTPENVKVKIITNKGDIVIACKVSESPASVANFLKCVDTGYYNNKSFHRYVPDFVIQGGCPRGDGWGSLNWMQRSEFSSELRYHPGSVGLASAGKDSEGVQFFITHSYTTNLDGKYTIFAEVVSGMDVVNSLRVGDKMISVVRID